MTASVTVGAKRPRGQKCQVQTPAPSNSEPAAQPLVLLRRLTGWMAESGMGVDHPWRAAIASTLAATKHPGAWPADAGTETSARARKSRQSRCLAEAMERFYLVKEDSRSPAPELHFITNQIGWLLNSVGDRIHRENSATEVVSRLLADLNTSEVDGVKALVDMTQSHLVDTCNAFFELADYVLSALDHFDLLPHPGDDPDSPNAPAGA